MVWRALLFSIILITTAAVAAKGKDRTWRPNVEANNCFDVLGAKKDESNDEIQKYYRILAMRYHPDRFSSESKDIQIKNEDIFTRVKAAFEAIYNLSERGLERFNLRLGLSQEEIRRRGGTGYDSTSASEETYTDSNWFTDEVNAKNNSASHEINAQTALFKSGISAIYQNSDGVIIRSNFKLFWLPRDNQIIYPITNTLNSGDGHFDGAFFDVRDPEGLIPIKIDDTVGELRVRDLIFKRIGLVDLQMLNLNLRKVGFRLYAEDINSADFNLWNYQIYFDGTTYTVLAELVNSRLPKDYQRRYRLFVGNWGNMIELETEINRKTYEIEVPSRNAVIRFGRSGQRTPFFDEASHLNLGTIEFGMVEMAIFELSGSKKLINRIPALPREDVYKLKLAGLLSDHIALPKIIRTPLDRHWMDSLRPKESLEQIRLLPHSNSRTNLELVTQQKHSDSKELARKGWSAWRIKREMKDLFPDLAKYFEYPDGDSERLATEFLLSGNLNLEDLRAYLIEKMANSSVRLIIERFFVNLKSWELIEATLFVPEMIIEQFDSDPQTMTALTKFSVRHLIRNSPFPFPPRVQQIITHLRSLEVEVINSYLEQYISERRKTEPKAITSTVLRIEESECGRLLTATSTPPRLN